MQISTNNHTPPPPFQGKWSFPKHQLSQYFSSLCKQSWSPFSEVDNKTTSFANIKEFNFMSLSVAGSIKHFRQIGFKKVGNQRVPLSNPNIRYKFRGKCILNFYAKDTIIIHIL